MGKRTKLREAQRRAEEQALAARLQNHCRTNCGPAFITTYPDFGPHFRDRIDAYRDFWVRSPLDWRCQLRVRSPDLRFLDLVRFTFARFPVPVHLENVWIGDTAAPGHVNADHDVDFRLWYITAATGGSLYKSFAHPFLSRVETHHFLSAPAEITEPQRALWYAVAGAQTGNTKLAVRAARTKLSGFAITDEFWKDAARFFARQPTSHVEMNDLIDYFQAMRALDFDYSLCGRSLPALRRRMEEWHQALRMAQTTCGERWTGRSMPNAAYTIDGATWRFKQIKTGWRLFEEGERMRHCVVTYKELCMQGNVSIWSLTCEHQGMFHRCATIQVDSNSEITQVRGFANRSPSRVEVDIIARWAAEHGLNFTEVFFQP